MCLAPKKKVAIVTGASRGIGRGIAIELGLINVKVYLTGRHVDKSEYLKSKTQTLEEVADEINKQGGDATCVYCDHSNPEEVKALFDQVDREQNGQLDILVNNAFSGVFHILSNVGKKFYEYTESPEEAFDIINNVGLRNNYICSVYAARMMVKLKSGVIFNISSIGAINYLFNIPYGFGKNALVRMSADMAIELANDNVCSISLLPGGVQTEIISKTILKGPISDITKYFCDGESSRFAGRVIAFMVQHPNLLQSYNGKAITTSEIADQFNVIDTDGRKHHDYQMDKYVNFLHKLNDVHLEQLSKKTS